MSTPKQLPGSVYAPDGSLYITLTDGNGNLVTAGGSSTITAGTTATSGITSGHLIGASSNLITDSGIVYSTLTGGPFLPLTGGTLTGNLTITPSSANTENLTLNLGTLTANTKAINITGTFNSSGTTFDAPLFMNITNTASAAGSLLADIQVGGSSVFTVNKAGYVSTNAIAASNWLSLDGTGALNQGTLAVRNGNVAIQNAILTFNSGYFSGNAANIALDGANLLALVNGTNANSLRVYNTSSSSNANYERGVFGWTDNSNVLTIGTQAGGTGTARNLEFVVGGVNKLDYGITTSAKWTSAAPIILPSSNSVVQLGLGGTSTGLSDNGFGTGVWFWVSGGVVMNVAAQQINLPNNLAILWSSTTASTGTKDTDLSRLSAGIVSVDTTSVGNALGSINLANLTASGIVTSASNIMTAYTVTTLPGTPSTGQVALVSDATSNVSLGAGGGSAYCLAAYNGSSWVAV